MRIMILTALVLALSGCATSGSKITEAQLSQIVEGQTTRQELIDLFGAPNSSIYNSDGTQILAWGYAHVGFAGIGTEVQSVSMVIGQDGRVKGYNRSGTEPMAAPPLRKAPEEIAPTPTSTAPEQPLSQKEYQDIQIEKLMQENVSYEEYQRRYKAIMAQ